MLRCVVVTRYTFGDPVSDEDVLVVQGVEYLMNPVGMRAMRRMLTIRSQVDPNRTEADEVTEDDLDLMIEVVVGVVRPEFRDALAEHIEASVSPALLSAIATAVMKSFSDLDPTQPESYSGGSLPTGSDSTAGALVGVSTPPI